MSDEYRPGSDRSPMSFRRSMMWLTIAMVVGFPLFALVGHQLSGRWGMIAAAIAGVVCWVGASAALVSAALMQSKSPIGGVLLGMIFRMGLPLVAGLILQETFVPLARTGILGFILGYYFLALAVETFLSVRMIPRTTKAMKTL